MYIWQALKWKMEGKAEKFWIWLSWKMPRKLAYWCAIRVGAHATTGKYGDTVVPGLSMMDMFKRWEGE